MSRSRVLVVAVLLGALAAGCRPSSTAAEQVEAPAPSPTVSVTDVVPTVTPTPDPTPPPSEPTPTPTPAPTPTPTPAPPPTTAPEPEPVPARPAWLGTRLLPLRTDGFGEVQPTPPELLDRRLPPSTALAAPADGTFHATIDAVPAEVVARSTWSPACPVTLADLRYLTVTYWGFDERPHTGELLVNVSVAEDLAIVFARLYEARFPIEEMLLITPGELGAPPTGDGNSTTAFVCRPTTGGSSWSQHAYGLAVDVNPFHNPYQRADLVLPELASAYTDRSWLRPGMIVDGDLVTKAFADVGWGWGGDWDTLSDRQHFSANGR